MTFLLDTNVVSEFRLDIPDPGVWAWASEVEEDRVFISVVTIAEVRSGIARLPDGKRRTDLDAWFSTSVRERFQGRILGIDERTAERCGELLGRNSLGIHIRRIMDFWLAALALHHGLTIVTRNERDFRNLGVRVLNPWNG